MPIQERHCENCGKRCRRGWLRVHEQGPEIHAPGANIRQDRESVYCSEKCLRTRLFDAAGNMQLIVDQQREIDRLKRKLNDTRQARWDEQAYSNEAELRSTIHRAADLAQAIEDDNLTNAQPGTEDAERLQRTVVNLLGILRPAMKARRP